MGNERRTFQSFKTYADTEPIITQLTDEEAGRIFKACYSCYFRGETMEFRPGDDRMFKGAWGTFEMKLLAEQKKDSETSQKRSSAGREGGLANAKGDKQKTASAKGDKQKTASAKGDKQKTASAKGDKQKTASVPTYTDTVTGTNSSTATISSTVTEKGDVVSVDRLTASAAAEDAEPSGGDLFSFEQIKAMARGNKVNLTDEGLRVFYEEMQDSGWILYQKPVEKKGIVKAIRGWTKNNPQYHLEPVTEQADSRENKPPKKILKSFKSWLKYNGYDSNYENGFGEFDEEIAIDEEMIQIVWSVDDLSESMQSINERLTDSGYSQGEIKMLMQLFFKWSKEKKQGR